MLCLLAHLSDAKGQCLVTNTDLSEILGVSRQTVFRRLKPLQEKTLYGKPIVTVNSDNTFQINKKVFQKNEIVQICNTPLYKKINIKNIKPTDVLKYFSEKFNNAYGSDYHVSNYGRELQLIKIKLLQQYGVELTYKIIDEAFRQRRLFETVKHPTITIGALTTFIPNAVLKTIKEQEVRNSQEHASVVFNKMMAAAAKDFFGDSFDDDYDEEYEN